MKVLSTAHGMLRIRRQRVFSLTDPAAIVVVDPKADIEISRVTLDSVERVTDFRTANHAAVFRRYLTDGQYGVYAWINGKVVGHGWAKVCTQSQCIVNRYMDLHKGEALIHYCNVNRAHRNKGVYTLMLASLCHRLFDEAQVKHIIIDTEADNDASLRGIAKAGFKPIGRGTFVQLMGRRIFKRVTGYDETITDRRRG